MTRLLEDFRTAELSATDEAMLTYAEKLARRPEAMVEEDVAALRRAGFNDAAILDIAQVTAYYSFVNRLAQGLGVEVEGYWEASGERRADEERRRRAAEGHGPAGPE